MTFENIENLMFECFLLENTTDASDAQVHIVGDGQYVKKSKQKSVTGVTGQMPLERRGNSRVCSVLDFYKTEPNEQRNDISWYRCTRC